MVAAALVAVSVPWAAGPAGADPKGGCPLGRICLYGGRGFTGDRWDVGADSRGGGSVAAGQSGPCTAAQVPIWSAVNRSGRRAATSSYRLHLFRSADCQRQASTVGPNVGRDDTGGSRSFALECLEPGACG